MVVTVTPALAMQIMLNVSKQFIVKLSNKQKTMVRDASTGSKPTSREYLARPDANTHFTVTNTIFICGNYIPTLFQGNSQAERISGELFDDKFMSCIDKTVKELDNNLKSHSPLTAANSQIPLNPG